MNVLLFAAPLIFMFFIGLLIYKHHGKKSVFRIDLIQFIYIFLAVPFLFVWSKTFLYQFLRENPALTTREIFALDTLYSTVFLFFAATMTIHGITKTYALRAKSTESFDFLHLNEYFHLWWSHLALFGTGLLLMLFLSVANLFLPLVILEPSQLSAAGGSLFGAVLGILIFFMVWNADPKQGKFMTIMKLLFTVFFIIHAIAYLMYRPAFNSLYIAYWIFFACGISLVIASMQFERSRKIQAWRSRFLPKNWGENNFPLR